MLRLAHAETPIKPGQIWREVDTKRLVRVLSVEPNGCPVIQTCDAEGNLNPKRRPSIAAYYRFATMPGTRTGADFLLSTSP